MYGSRLRDDVGEGTKEAFIEDLISQMTVSDLGDLPARIDFDLCG